MKGVVLAGGSGTRLYPITKEILPFCHHIYYILLMDSKRVARNTIILYVRMIAVIAINLIVIRLVLNALGAVDYGIYNVIFGIVTLFNSVSTVIASGTQRYYAYNMGKDESLAISNVFSTSLNIYIFLSFILILLGETVGLWFVNNELIIPTDRMMAANIIYQFTIFSIITSMIRTPFSGMVIAYEDMNVFALITIAEYILLLFFSLSLKYVPFDSLIFYGFIYFLIQFLLTTSYALYAKKKYTVCKYHLHNERKLYKELLSFSGWLLFTSSAGIAIIQICTILINVFFGPLVNASRAISLQVSSALGHFSGSYVMAIKPPMIKAYAKKDYEEVLRTFYISNKFVYYCMTLVCIPLLLETKYVLHLWLNTDNIQAVEFTQLVIIYTIIMSLSHPIAIIVHATGKLKEFTIPVETVTILCAPLTYVAFKMGFDAAYTFYAMILCSIFAHIVRLICLKRLFCIFSIRQYVSSFVIPASILTIMVLVITNQFQRMFIESIWRICGVCVVSTLSLIILLFAFGLSSSERNLIIQYIRKYIQNRKR